MKILSICSLVYYGWWNPPYVLLLVTSIGFNFILGELIRKSQSIRSLVAIGIGVNLLLLCYFKYAGFIISNLNYLSGGDFVLHEILLPIGISFFTFQQITYLSDVGRGDCPKYRFFDYLLFVTFFPQLIAGPIVHHREMMPQFTNDNKEQGNFQKDFAIGSTLFVIGLAKKVIIADNLAPYASNLFGSAFSGSPVNIIDSWIGVIAYTFQLYFDFSGYSDMALGIGAMFGIFLPVNFLSPYKSKDLIEFWRRWHISLSRFLKEYVYIPLGGNRSGTIRGFSNLIITMLIGGFWHGANWTFVVWGLLHGIGLVLNHLFKKLVPNALRSLLGIRIVLAVFTFCFVSLTWVLFRSENFATALSIYNTMFALEGLVLPNEMHLDFPISGAIYAGDFHMTHVVHVIIAALIAFLGPNSIQIIQERRFLLPLEVANTRFLWRPSIRWAVLIIGLFVASLCNMSGLSEFLYYQF
tara:strand:+ start:1976 stop:3376 length:1401 start_codon:yes stop_codon:yes gene_type:complete